jgi:hypothetical protein
MSGNGVILQHRAKLIAYLFVDRSDNLLIGNHIKSFSPTTGDCNWENTATYRGPAYRENFLELVYLDLGHNHFVWRRFARPILLGGFILHHRSSPTARSG